MPLYTTLYRNSILKNKSLGKCHLRSWFKLYKQCKTCSNVQCFVCLYERTAHSKNNVKSRSTEWKIIAAGLQSIEQHKGSVHDITEYKRIRHCKARAQHIDAVGTKQRISIFIILYFFLQNFKVPMALKKISQFYYEWTNRNT